MSYKKTKLSRSNQAHRRLKKKYERIYGSAKGSASDVAFIKMNYHHSVAYQQSRLKRVLTPEEKRRSYDSVIKAFY